jgi:hypothetical protein
MRITTAIFCSLFVLAGCNDDTGTLTGLVTDDYGEPVSGAIIRLEGTDYSATTLTDGRYTIADVEPGTYTVTGMAPAYDFDVLRDVEVGAGETVELDLNAYSEDYAESVRKPNIYLYPQETAEVSVRLNFPAGGGVTVSEPMYLDGWQVEATPEGVLTSYGRVISDHSTPASSFVSAEPVPTGACTYLFYEADVPVEWDTSDTYVVKKEDLEAFFRDNLELVGFRGREIEDFVSYWVPRLNAHPYYLLHPNYADDIAPLIGLEIHPEPDSLLRLYYLIEGVTEDDERLGVLYRPSSPPVFERTGFAVVEWGVILGESTLLHP